MLQKQDNIKLATEARQYETLYWITEPVFR